jgi:hypothetical protein
VLTVDPEQLVRAHPEFAQLAARGGGEPALSAPAPVLAAFPSRTESWPTPRENPLAPWERTAEAALRPLRADIAVATADRVSRRRQELESALAERSAADAAREERLLLAEQQQVTIAYRERTSPLELAQLIGRPAPASDEARAAEIARLRKELQSRLAEIADAHHAAVEARTRAGRIEVAREVARYQAEIAAEGAPRLEREEAAWRGAVGEIGSRLQTLEANGAATPAPMEAWPVVTPSAIPRALTGRVGLRPQLTAALRRETLATARALARQRGDTLRFAPATPGQPDDTAQVRGWLVAYWREQPPEGASRMENP